MSEFRIYETEEFLKALKGFPQTDRRFLQRKLSQYVYPQLREEPFFGPNIKKLHGYSPDTWRYRIGRYRVFYTIDEDEKVVPILTVHRRRDAYR